jgi:hypothetical protein
MSFEELDVPDKWEIEEVPATPEPVRTLDLQ